MRKHHQHLASLIFICHKAAHRVNHG